MCVGMCREGLGLGRESGTGRKTPLERQGAGSEGRPASGLTGPACPRLFPALAKRLVGLRGRL